jgi:hypothetical protein
MEPKTIKNAECLEFRTTTIDLDELELRYNLRLPPIYRAFIANFEDLRGQLIKVHDELETLTYYVYYTKDHSDTLFEDFLPIENSLKYRDSSDFWIEQGVMPIGRHSHGGGIVIGIREDNMDKIFYNHDSHFEFIEPNVFSFVRNLKWVESDSKDFGKVYRNWNEDFWKIEE